MLSIAASGCYLEWDLFGNEGSYYPLADLDMPSDAQRLDLIKGVVDAGYADKIVIAQDICTNHRLVRYGGHGYGHILENVVPAMRRKGLFRCGGRGDSGRKSCQDSGVCLRQTPPA